MFAAYVVVVAVVVVVVVVVVVFATNGFCVLHIGLCGCVNFCCNGFMGINSDF